MRTTLGIDIGGTSVKLAVVADGRCLWTGRSALYAKPDRALFVRLLSETLGAAPELDRVERFGLCVPGLLDPATLALTLSANHPGLVGLPLDALLTEALRRPIGRDRLTTATDAHAAAFDFWRTASPAIAPGERLLAISLGTGVGGCVLDDGVPLRVSGLSSGHMGQIDLGLDLDAHDRPLGPDGGAGSAEAYLGVAALRHRYGPDLAAALDRLSIDDPPVRALIQLIRVTHAIYRPKHLALLGGIGIRLGRLVNPIQAAASVALTRLARPGWTLRCGQSDFHAACGVAGLAAQTP